MLWAIACSIMFILDIQLRGLDRSIHIEGTQFTAMMCLKGLAVVCSERRQLKSRDLWWCKMYGLKAVETMGRHGG